MDWQFLGIWIHTIVACNHCKQAWELPALLVSHSALKWLYLRCTVENLNGGQCQATGWPSQNCWSCPSLTLSQLPRTTIIGRGPRREIMVRKRLNLESAEDVSLWLQKQSLCVWERLWVKDPTVHNIWLRNCVWQVGLEIITSLL